MVLISCSFGCWGVMIFYYGGKQTTDLNHLLRLIDEIQDSKKNSENLAKSKWREWNSRDASLVFNAFLKIEKIISQALKFDAVSENEALFLYAHCIKIFEALGNSRLLGIVYNNRGNH